MPRKKDPYYELKKFLIEDQGFQEPAAIKLTKEIYDIWRKDESQNIIDVFNAQMEEDLAMEGLPESEASGDDNIENQAESSAKQEEETPDQNLEELKVKTGPATSAPTKFDWEKYLEENPQFKTKDKDSGVEVLLLQFFKDIAHKEGFLSVRYLPLGNADQGYCGVSCEIEWPNLPRISSGLADAHFNNCHSFTKYYLAPMCENRSFIRAVKQYFNIPYLGKDEIGQTPKEEPKNDEAPTGPYVTLKKAAKDKLNITSFDGFKEFLRKQVIKDKKEKEKNPDYIDQAWLDPTEYEEWAGYNDWQEIKKPKILELIGKIKA